MYQVALAGESWALEFTQEKQRCCREVFGADMVTIGNQAEQTTRPGPGKNQWPREARPIDSSIYIYAGGRFQEVSTVRVRFHVIWTSPPRFHVIWILNPNYKKSDSA